MARQAKDHYGEVSFNVRWVVLVRVEASEDAEPTEILDKACLFYRLQPLVDARAFWMPFQFRGELKHLWIQEETAVLEVDRSSFSSGCTTGV